ncbi:hypothetical protein OSJ77_05240 [Phyllobacterium sp. 0TCS1.6C]|jgi:hypothetical protein|nr:MULTISPECIES: hypothetical protein [unclassified Phyllobacterium]MCX8279583.1 hypothetical protein [Phyllobacterium sp. 0TCS1.6C]MCX8292226.1 hypothetical protein [Phyllobacterium sp. 0TCS1.6A]
MALVIRYVKTALQNLIAYRMAEMERHAVIYADGRRKQQISYYI